MWTEHLFINARIFNQSKIRPVPRVIVALLINLNDELKKTREKNNNVENSDIRALFVWPWNGIAQRKPKQQTNGNRAISLVYRTVTNARGFWLVERTLRWKKLHAWELSRNHPILRFDVILQHKWQSSNAFSILGFSLAGKRRVHVLIFSSIGW